VAQQEGKSPAHVSSTGRPVIIKAGKKGVVVVGVAIISILIIAITIVIIQF
jgi:hypothetical protein